MANGFLLSGIVEGQQAADEAALRQKTLDLAIRGQDFNEKFKTEELGMQKQRLVIEDKKQLREYVNSLQAGIKDGTTAIFEARTKNPYAPVDFLVERLNGFANSLDSIGAVKEAADARAQIAKIAPAADFASANTQGATAAGQAQTAQDIAKVDAAIVGNLGGKQGQVEGQKIEAAAPAKAAEAAAVAGATAGAQLPFQIQLEQAKKSIEAAASAANPKKDFAQSDKLRDEFNTLTKDFRTVNDAFNKIQKVSDTGAGDMSLLYSYVKLLDPGSVVRESEFATAAASGSFGERIQGLAQRIATGQRLPPTLRRDFLAEASNIYNGQKVQYDTIKDRYTGIAKKYGLDVADVIVDTTVAPTQDAGPLSNVSAEELMRIKKALGGKSN